MASPSERAFWKDIQRRSFEPVYYLVGEDEYLKEQAVRQLVAAAVDPATRDFNLDVRRAAEVDGETLGSLLGTPPMMADRRVVVLRDVAALRKDARAALDRYLERPAPDLLLVLVAAAGERAKPDRRLQAARAVEFPPLAEDRVPRWIAHHVTELGGTITPAAAVLLHGAVGNDLPALAAELDKLLSFTSGAEIDEAAVTEVVGVRRGETLGDLLDRVAMRDAAGALALLPHVLAQPKMAAVPIVMALTTQTLAIAYARAGRDEGWPPTRVEQELWALLKETNAYAMRPWGEAVRTWARAVEHWSPDALDRTLAALLAADATLKETRLSSDEQVMGTLILGLCVEDQWPVASGQGSVTSPAARISAGASAGVPFAGTGPGTGRWARN